jgi:hypothetical protein
LACKRETLFWRNTVEPDLARLPHTYYRKTQELAKRGILDVEICIRGLYVALELKKDLETELAAWTNEGLQANNVFKIRKAGGRARFVSPESWEPVYYVLRDYAYGGERVDLDAILNYGPEKGRI